jgi:hypothetical protein
MVVNARRLHGPSNLCLAFLIVLIVLARVAAVCVAVGMGMGCSPIARVPATHELFH